jgi:hypothetical protein
MPLDTGYLYRQGATGQTKTVNSQRNRVYAPLVGEKGLRQIGVLGTFQVSQSRAVNPVRGIGNGDQLSELVPGNTEPTQITMTRTALYLQNLMQSLGYKAGASGAVRSLKHQKWPFDIRQEIVFSEISSESKDIGQAAKWDAPNPEGGKNNVGYGGVGDLRVVFTIFEGCWMSNWSYEFSSDNIIVSEQGTIHVSDEFDGQDSVYGMFIDSGLNKNDATGRSLRFKAEQ